MNKYRRYFVTALIGVSLVILLGAIWGVSIYRAQHSVNHAWVDHELEIVGTLRSFDELNRLIGYGGLIHQFKNYILRQTAEYEEKVEQSVSAAREEAENLRSFLKTPEENAALDQIMETVEQYYVEFSVARRMTAQGASISAIDDAVVVPDDPALQAQERLKSLLLDRTEMRMTSARESLSSLKQLILSGALLIPPLLMLAGFLFLLFRRLQATMTSLEDSKTEVELLLETTPDSVLGVREDGTIFRANKTAAQYFGYGDALLGMKVEALMPESFRADHVHKRMNYFRSPEVREMAPARRVYALLADGEKREVSVKLGFYASLSGPTAVISIRDVTEESGFKAAIIESQQRMDFAASVARFGIWEWTPNDDFIIWDRWTHELHGTQLGTFKPRYERWLSLVHPDDRDAVDIEVQNAFQTSTSISTEYRVILPNGLVRYLHLSAAGQRDGNPSMLRVTGVCTDVTTKRKAQRALEVARTQAIKANEIKGQFLANMSHEIRTPMNAIMGLLTLLDDSELGGRQKQMVNTAYLSARSLLGILNDILDFSKLDAGKVNIVKSAFKLDGVLEKTTDLFSYLVGDQDVSLYLAVDPTVYSDLVGDSLRLNQVLTNLLSNAIKFTKKGSVTLTVLTLEVTEHDCLLRFSVRDTGIGMNEAQVARSMGAFDQADMTTTRNFGGTGLGLTICASLLDLMNSELEITSQPGEGTEVSFDLRFKLGKEARRYSELSVDVSEIMVVMEDKRARGAILHYLDAWGVTAVCFDDPKQALEAIRDPEIKAEFLLTDLTADAGPGQLERLLHAWGRDRPNQSDNVILLQAGHLGASPELDVNTVNPFLVPSPPTPSRLFDAFSARQHSVVRGKHSPASRIREAVFKAASCRGSRILVVEDAATNQIIARDFLALLGMQVEIASEGVEALERLGSSEFDAVLMDVHMPGMNGLETTRQIRKIPALESMPVIAMTAAAYGEDQTRAVAAGMNAYLVKPVDIVLLAEALAEHLPSRSDTQEPDITGLAAIGGLQPELVDLAGLPDEFDEEILRVNFGTGPRLFLACLGAFSKDFTGWVSQFEEAEQNRDVMEMKALLHKLKGASENIAAKKMASLAAETHASLNMGDSVEELEALVILKQSLQNLLEGIDRKIPASLGSDPRSNIQESEIPIETLESLEKLSDNLALNRYIPVDILDTWLSRLPSTVSPELLRELRRSVEAFEYTDARACLAQVIDIVRLEIGAE